ncbi:hypothetical protein [Pseudoduganella umbonata]|uniref:Uncharacterized protein n=1 Tax=Pseudoduganella umbonata TaxID=864828 RepID=A0A4P8HIM7_9BURK|nr:hypothetical protein [Pseudoduganella umbonata]MBB3219296.1 hypothetical protein [Pseudoduganella umbonata]QCP09403.1 hypothetical protein FCL38_02420 [Pseudoduganella umbonata]
MAIQHRQRTSEYKRLFIRQESVVRMDGPRRKYRWQHQGGAPGEDVIARHLFVVKDRANCRLPGHTSTMIGQSPRNRMNIREGYMLLLKFETLSAAAARLKQLFAHGRVISAVS